MCHTELLTGGKSNLQVNKQTIASFTDECYECTFHPFVGHSGILPHSIYVARASLESTSQPLFQYALAIFIGS
jgi:hypothetical protein